MSYITGFHAIEERLKAGGTGSLLVAKAGPRAMEIIDLAVESKVRVDRVGSFDLDRLAPGNRGIALRIEDNFQDGVNLSLDDYLGALEDRQDALALILDEITDPHNYGAILRSCDQFGVDIVISRNRRNAKHAGVVSQTSAGAVSWVPQAEVPNLVRAVGQLKDAGFWIYGADMKGEPVYEKDMRGRAALVLGGEGSGISRLLKENCDGLIGIPSRGKIDSLNVSVAAGVLLYEVTRQRVSEE